MFYYYSPTYTVVLWFVLPYLSGLAAVVIVSENIVSIMQYEKDIKNE